MNSLPALHSLKKQYLHAETLDERRVLAILAANVVWGMKRRASRFPTKEFLDEFLEPFVQYEKHKLQSEKLHHITQKIAKEEEVQHEEAAVYWSKKAVERFSPTD